MPILRHDWRVPVSPRAEGPWLEGFSDGWLPGGIGDAQPYPTFYLVGFALAPLAAFCPTLALMAVVVAGAAALAAWSAADVARGRGASAPTQLAVAIFAALNPWVYTKLVAGHMIMVLAYALLFALVAAIMRRRRAALVLLAAALVTQIEFLAVACVPLALWAWRARERRAVAALALAAAPLALGIGAYFEGIAETPFTLAWQTGQSLDPGAAVALDGYFTHYAKAFGPWWFVADAFALAAALAVPAALRSAAGRTAAAFAAALLVFVTGTKGVAGAAYAWLVLHVPPVGLFRELYDLVAVVAIAYVVLLCHGPARDRRAGAALAALAALWLVPWIAAPPTAWFVPAASVAEAAHPADPQHRVAYLPAFQPLSRGDSGSGVDPDAYAQAGRSAPLNEPFPQWPVDAALAYLERGDGRYARALGAAAVVRRPALRSNAEALRDQRVAAGRPRAAAGRPPPPGPLMPMLAVVPAPRIVAIGSDPAEDAVFFGDADPSRVARFAPSAATMDPAAGWVDARLAVPAAPELGNAFGGVTTTGRQPLALPPGRRGRAVLALVRGRLLTAGGALVRAGDDAAFRWDAVPAGTTALRCAGACTVALAGDVPPGLPADAPPGPFAPVAVRFVRPWLATAALPAGASGALRLAVRWNGAWVAVSGGRLLPHVRLATALDGWLLPAAAPARAVWFVDAVAAGQLALELAAAALVALWTATAMRRGQAAVRRGAAAAASPLGPAASKDEPLVPPARRKETNPDSSSKRPSSRMQSQEHR